MRPLAAAMLAPIALVGLATGSAPAQVFPTAPRSYNVAKSAFQVVLSDLDSDGNDDVVVATDDGFLAFEINIRLGAGDGTFPVGLSYSPGFVVFGIGAADVNSDGKPDLVLTKSVSPQTTAIAISLGSGNGNFANPYDVQSGLLNAHLVASGDLNGDGTIDVAVHHSIAGNNLSLLFGDGAGGFGAPVILNPNFPATALSVVDVDGDGHLDLLGSGGVPPFAGAVSARLGDGAGGFGPLISSSYAAPLKSHTPADLTGDGILDVACPANSTPPQILTIPGFGNGGFGPSIPNAVTTGTLAAAKAADMDGDGDVDVVATTMPFSAGFLDPLVRTYANNGSAVLTEGQGVRMGGQPIALALGDLDHDSRPDAVVLEYNAASFAIVRNDGNGGFVGPGAYKVPPGPTGLRAGDFDHDGFPDVVACQFVVNGPESVSILRGDGTGALGAPASFPAGPAFLDPFDLVVVDVNLDHRPDVLVMNSSGSVGVFLGTGAGTLGPVTTFYCQSFPAGIVAEDLDLDGLPDAAVSNNLSVDAVNVLYGNGNGTFPLPVQYSVGSQEPNGIATADLNRDHRPDLVTANISADDLSVLLGKPGGFAGPSVYSAGSSPRHLVLADLDENGAADPIVASGNSNNVTVHLATGTGGLGSPTTTPKLFSDFFTAALAAGDVDGDGHVDVVVGGANATIAFLRGDGAGNLTEGENYRLGEWLNDLTLVDLNLDGRLDLVAAHSATNIPNDELVVVLGAAPAISGASPFGTGSPGCVGRLGLAAAVPPKLGTHDFTLLATNAPRRSSGFVMFSDVPDFAGSDSLSVGALLHVDILTGTTVLVGHATSDDAGVARAVQRIPNDPNLANVTLYAQTLWYEKVGFACGGSPFALVSSRALALVLAP